MSSQLLELQRRMATAVMQPLTRQETMRQRRGDGTQMQHEAGAFIRPNDSLTSFERLEIYNRQYWFRLYSSFEEDFPGLRTVLGRKQFEQVMRTYLRDCPSASFTLRNLGSRLPEWLQGEAQLTQPRTRLAWDMACLEWAHIEAFDAAALPLPSREYLASIGPQTQLHLQPHVRLLKLSYPVDELLIQVRHGEGGNETSGNNAINARRSRHVRRVAELDPVEIYLAVHRQEFMVYYKRLQPEEYRMLQEIETGASLGAVVETAFEGSSIAEADQSSFLQQTFQTWAILGWLYQPDAVEANFDATGER